MGELFLKVLPITCRVLFQSLTVKPRALRVFRYTRWRSWRLIGYDSLTNQCPSWKRQNHTECQVTRCIWKLITAICSVYTHYSVHTPLIQKVPYIKGQWKQFTLYPSNKVKHLPIYPTGLLFLGSIAPCISSLFFKVSLMQYWIFFQAFAESTHSVSCAKVFCFCFISDGLLHSPYISRDQHFCLNTSPARESQHCCCRCANVCKKKKKKGCLTKGATKSQLMCSLANKLDQGFIFYPSQFHFLPLDL